MCDPEIFPPHSSAVRIPRSTIFFPLGFTALVLVLLVVLKNDADKSGVLTAYLLFWFLFAAYICSGIKTNLIAYIFPGLFVYAEFTTPLATPFFYLFRTVLPGSPPPNPGLFDTVSSTFIGSGLMEELMKALPVLIGLYLAKRPTTFGKSADGYLNSLRCSTPMEGMMVGFAAGAGFVFVDTLYHVVPDSGLYVENPDNFGNGLDGFVLLCQRVLQGLISHVFWTSISGFFIGLCARHPRYLPILLATAWVLPAGLHTLWNLSPYLGGGTRWIKVGLPLLLFVACFIRARQLDARREARAGKQAPRARH
jgi:RsiW-degrading membrane proteinase PrsW (M82 family)